MTRFLRLEIVTIQFRYEISTFPKNLPPHRVHTFTFTYIRQKYLFTSFETVQTLIHWKLEPTPG